MYKQALNAYKKQYHTLSKKNQKILRDNVLKGSGDVAMGVEKGNDALMKKYRFGNISEEVFPSSRTTRGNTYGSPYGSIDIVMPKDFSSLKGDKSSLESDAVIKAFRGTTGAGKLKQGDKELLNAVAKRNNITKITKGFEAQHIGEGSYSPYYKDQGFAKKLKRTRGFADRIGNKGEFKDVIKENYGKIDSAKDMKQATKRLIQDSSESMLDGGYGEGLIDENWGSPVQDAIDKKLKSGRHYKDPIPSKPSFLQHIDKKKLGKGALIAGATVGAGLGAKYLYDKNKKKKAEREEKVAYYKQEIMEKVASYKEW